MTVEELGSLGEAISGFAVVVSLLYVAYEVRTNTRTVRAASAADSQDSLATINQVMASEGGLSGIYARAAELGSMTDLTPEESTQLILILRANTQRFESMYFRYEAGLLEERVWTVRRRWMAGFLKTPLGAEWWAAERDASIYTRDFIDDIESADGVALAPSTQAAI